MGCPLVVTKTDLLLLSHVFESTFGSVLRSVENLEFDGMCGLVRGQ